MESHVRGSSHDGEPDSSTNPASPVGPFRFTIPTRQARASAAAITAGTAVLAAVVAGMAESLLFLVTGVYGFSGADFTAADLIGVQDEQFMDPRLSTVAGCVVYAVAVLTAARLGRSAMGDPVMEVTAVTGTGARAGRWRVLANVALPVVVFAAVAAALGTTAGLVVTALLWAPALVRADRRSAYSLVTGTHYRVYAPMRDEVRDWSKVPRSEPKAVSPYRDDEQD